MCYATMSNYIDSYRDYSLKDRRMEQDERINNRRFGYRKAKLTLNLNQNDNISQKLMSSNYQKATPLDLNENDDETSILQDDEYDLQHYQLVDSPTRIHSGYFSAENKVVQKHKTELHKFYLSALKQIIEYDGTMSLRQMRKALTDKIDQERRYNKVIPKISVSKIVKILDQAGYKQTHSKTTNLKENIARREEFCRYLKKLIDNKIPIYFYHESELGKSQNKIQSWTKREQRVQVKKKISYKVLIRCLLSPNGIACWQVTCQNTNRQKLQSLINKLQKSDSQYDKTGRKFLMLDKRGINNRDQFCDLVQQNEFDIISMPAGSIGLNPINRFFKRVNKDLKNEYYSSKEELLKKCEYILLSFNSSCLGSYLQYFHRDILNGLPFE